MTAYELNKLVYTNVSSITNFDGVKKQIASYAMEHPSSYYMLLNNENHYYTIFVCKSNNSNNLPNEVLEIAKSLGEIKDVCSTQDGLEFWINYNGEIAMFILFDYAEGIVEVF